MRRLNRGDTGSGLDADPVLAAGRRRCRRDDLHAVPAHGGRHRGAAHRAAREADARLTARALRDVQLIWSDRLSISTGRWSWRSGSGTGGDGRTWGAASTTCHSDIRGLPRALPHDRASPGGVAVYRSRVDDAGRRCRIAVPRILLSLPSLIHPLLLRSGVPPSPPSPRTGRVVSGRRLLPGHRPSARPRMRGYAAAPPTGSPRVHRRRPRSPRPMACRDRPAAGGGDRAGPAPGRPAPRPSPAGPPCACAALSTRMRRTWLFPVFVIGPRR